MVTSREKSAAELLAETAARVSDRKAGPVELAAAEAMAEAVAVASAAGRGRGVGIGCDGKAGEGIERESEAAIREEMANRAIEAAVRAEQEAHAISAEALEVMESAQDRLVDNEERNARALQEAMKGASGLGWG